MARPFKLNDLQLVLLSTAAQRADGSLLPPSDSIGAPASRIRKVIPPLIKQALVDEVEVGSNAQAWRTDGDLQIGIVITDAGREAIRVAPAAAAPARAIVAPLPASDTPQPKGSKIAMVLQLLEREQGATLSELTTATGWQPHTMRAALTGLRRKGHQLDKRKRDDSTCWHVAA